MLSPGQAQFGGRWPVSNEKQPRATDKKKCRQLLIECTSELSVCCRRRLWERALLILGRLTKQGLVEPDSMAVATAACACSKGRQWRRGVHILADMKSSQLRPTTVPYNAVAAACGKNGQWQVAFQVIRALRVEAVQPDIFSYNILISACDDKSVMLWRRSLDLMLSQMTLEQLQPDLVSHNAGISSCSENNKWDYSLELLEKLRQRHGFTDEVGPNAALAACARMSKWEVVLSLVSHLRRSNNNNPSNSNNKNSNNNSNNPSNNNNSQKNNGSSPDCGLRLDVITCNSVALALGKGFQWSLALHAVEAGKQEAISELPTLVTCSSLTSAVCAAPDGWVRALVLLQEARRRALETNIVIFSSASRACSVEQGQWAQALALLHSASSIALKADGAALVDCLGACRAGRHWKLALSMLSGHHEQQTGFRVSVVATNAALSALASVKSAWPAALALFRHFWEVALQPDAASWSATLIACPGWEAALTLATFGLRRVNNTPESSETIVQGAVLSACEGRLWQVALHLSNCQDHVCRGQVKGADVDATRGALAGALTLEGFWRSALSLLFASWGSRLQANIVSLNAAASAWVLSGNWAQPLALLKHMWSNVVEPNAITLKATVGSCTVSTYWVASLRLLQTAAERGVPGNVAVAGAGVAACETGRSWVPMDAWLDEVSSFGLASVTARIANTVERWGRSYPNLAELFRSILQIPKQLKLARSRSEKQVAEEAVRQAAFERSRVAACSTIITTVCPLFGILLFLRASLVLWRGVAVESLPVVLVSYLLFLLASSGVVELTSFVLDVLAVCFYAMIFVSAFLLPSPATVLLLSPVRCLARAMIGLTFSNTKLTVICSIPISVANIYKLIEASSVFRIAGGQDSDYVILAIASEVVSFLMIIFVVCMVEKLFKEKVDVALDAVHMEHSLHSKRKLLSVLCDAHVELGHDFRILGRCTELSQMLMTGFGPNSNGLGGTVFTTLLAEIDQRRFVDFVAVSAMPGRSESDDNDKSSETSRSSQSSRAASSHVHSSAPAKSLHVSIRDAAGVRFPIELFHVLVHNMRNPSAPPSHLIGIREEPGGHEISTSFQQLGSRTSQASSDSGSSRGGGSRTAQFDLPDLPSIHRIEFQFDGMADGFPVQQARIYFKGRAATESSACAMMKDLLPESLWPRFRGWAQNAINDGMAGHGDVYNPTESAVELLLPGRADTKLCADEVQFRVEELNETGDTQGEQKTTQASRSMEATDQAEEAEEEISEPECESVAVWATMSGIQQHRKKAKKRSSRSAQVNDQAPTLAAIQEHDRRMFRAAMHDMLENKPR
ncbi:unnamed protein product [Polarella glacialis]|uniref:Pentatricopeptide repeat-containing protein, chloroplastic n=1 Tax=Polarella glacialis TaxID=89957 RepID=A0A813DBP0_POLGL|nr:unnamed protein product [Polarella glacialis]